MEAQFGGWDMWKHDEEHESNVTRTWDVTTSTPILTYGVVAAEVVTVSPKQKHINIPPSCQPQHAHRGKMLRF